jgi:hypothetical protein
MRATWVVAVYGVLAGCDRTGDEFRPVITGVPPIRHLGEMRVIPADSFDTNEEISAWQAYDPAWTEPGEDGKVGVMYEQLGAPENVGIYGGATATFTGTGGRVCVLVDPEMLFWVQSRKPLASGSAYLYEDLLQDDGDVDLEAGLTAAYTGSPGVTIGEFEVAYTDEAGVEHQIPANDCATTGYGGTPDVHSGRATYESCVLNTAGHQGASYTILLKTFMLPLDDSILNFGLAVFEGDCADVPQRYGKDATGAGECTLAAENTLGVPDALAVPGEDGVDPCEDPDTWYWGCYEDRFCGTVKNFNNYCAAHAHLDGAPCIDNGQVPQEIPEEDSGLVPI